MFPGRAGDFIEQENQDRFGKFLCTVLSAQVVCRGRTLPVELASEQMQQNEI
jgi:hypothetical protein